MKKQSCRRSKEEKKIHDEAVRIRRMSDKQLVEHIDQLGKQKKIDLRNILFKISQVKGVGELKMAAIEKILIEEMN